MVAVLMAIVGFFSVRIIYKVDDMNDKLSTMKEAQAKDSEVISGLQRDRERSEREFERLKNQVDSLKENNAVIKAELSALEKR